MTGWFVVAKIDKRQYSFVLKAANSQVILRSRHYEPKTSAQGAIASGQANVPLDERYELATTSDGRFASTARPATARSSAPARWTSAKAAARQASNRSRPMGPAPTFVRSEPLVFLMEAEHPAPLRRSSSPSSKRCRRIALAIVASATMASAVHAQPVSDQVRAQVASARLGSGYAQMINLSATPDLSAASYRLDGTDPDADLDVLRLPYQAKWLPLSTDADLYWNLKAGWLQFAQDFPVNPATDAAGTIGSKWTAYSVGAGMVAKIRLGNGFSLEPALEVALARLQNRASYGGSATSLQPVLDGLLFNWNANAWLVTPGVALDWTDAVAAGTARVRGHVARSWIASFNETDPVQQFREATNIYSVRVEYVQPTAWKTFERPLSWLAYAGYAGFFGANRDVLGFDAVAELGGGLEFPLAPGAPQAERLRVQAAYLVGSGVRGWTVGLGLQY
jgi:uncharacterized protein YegP (UPF0339 family)